MSRFMDMCRLVEKNDPPIKKLIFRALALNSCYQYFALKISCDEQEHGFDDYNLKSPSMWSCFGEAVRKNKTLETLELFLELNTQDANTIDVPPEAAQCLNELYNGLIKNKSIKILCLQFPNSNHVPVFDLDRFIRYKKGLNELRICSTGPLPRNHCTIIATAVTNNSVVALDLRGCDWGEDGVHDVISACSKVKKLQLLQRNTTTTANQAYTILVGTLTGNHTLTLLEIDCQGNLEVLKGQIWSSIFKLMLQDPSSIDCICNSNHSLERLILTYGGRFIMYNFNEKFLKLNRYNNKNIVIQEKIAHYYLRDDFDVAPFANMNLWLVPMVMNLIKKG